MMGKQSKEHLLVILSYQEWNNYKILFPPQNFTIRQMTFYGMYMPLLVECLSENNSHLIHVAINELVNETKK